MVVPLFSSKHIHIDFCCCCVFLANWFVDAEVIAEQEERSETLSRFRKWTTLHTLNCWTFCLTVWGWLALPFLLNISSPLTSSSLPFLDLCALLLRVFLHHCSMKVSVFNRLFDKALLIPLFLYLMTTTTSFKHQLSFTHTHTHRQADRQAWLKTFSFLQKLLSRHLTPPPPLALFLRFNCSSSCSFFFLSRSCCCAISVAFQQLACCCVAFT